MRIISNRKFRNSIGAIVMGLVIGNLVGCPSSNSSSSSPSSSSDPSGQLTGTMLTSTADSGLTVTVGMPRGDIAEPAGNPITLSTVPSAAQQAAAGYTRATKDDPSVSYSGNWVSGNMPAGANSPAMESTAAGAQARYTFTGIAVRWIGYRDAWSGVADVYLDGIHVTSVDTYSTVAKADVVLYSASGLPDATHTLAIQVEGAHNSASLGSAVWVGTFDAQLSAGTPSLTSAATTEAVAASSGGYTRIEQNNAAVNYSGSWTTESSTLTANFSGGSAAESSASAARATLAFNGTAVRWIGYRDTLSGIADVYLDGAHVSTVDTYSLLPESQVVMYTATGLATGNHSLTIKAQGRHSLLSLGSAVWVDAFDVQQPPPDTTPPTASMTAPQNGTTVSDRKSVVDGKSV